MPSNIYTIQMYEKFNANSDTNKLLIKNIKSLVQVRDTVVLKVSGAEMKELPCIENAWLAVDNGLIADYGSMDDFPGIEDRKGLEIIDNKLNA